MAILRRKCQTAVLGLHLTCFRKPAEQAYYSIHFPTDAVLYCLGLYSTLAGTKSHHPKLMPPFLSALAPMSFHIAETFFIMPSMYGYLVDRIPETYHYPYLGNSISVQQCCTKLCAVTAPMLQEKEATASATNEGFQ